MKVPNYFLFSETLCNQFVVDVMKTTMPVDETRLTGFQM